MTQNKEDKQTLKKLAKDFSNMCEQMHKHHFAHGDLQHGNIMVGKDGKLYLVDYDSMYTPSLQGAFDDIKGKDEYQRPKRKDNKFAHEKLDYFSELIIYISILGVAENPDFVEEYQLKDAERMLFSKNDFQNITQSKIYQELQALKGEFLILLRILVDYLSKSDIQDLIPFEPILRKYNKPPKIKSFGFDEGAVLLKGKSYELKWNLENVSEISKIYLDEQLLPTAAKSEQISRNKTGTCSFTLRVVNGLKSVEKQITVSVVDSASVTLHVNKLYLRKGKENHVVIDWEVGNAQKATLIVNGKSEEIPFKGNRMIDCQNDWTHIIIEALNRDSHSHEQESVNVQKCTPCAIRFNADKRFTVPSVPVQLTWSVSNAKAVKINGKEVKHSGKRVVKPDQETEYAIEATDVFSTKTKSITIKMLPLPTVKSFCVPVPNIEKNVTVISKFPRLQAKIDNLIRTPELTLPILEQTDNPLTGNKDIFSNKFHSALTTIKNKVNKLSKK